ncbi:hypothetical protein H8E88_18240 [candidate division KSB1 bacterium]|nr:hypothetical protein [candidate division KSB1 bacterium]
MKLMRQGPSDKSYWLQCSSCSSNTLVTIDELAKYEIKEKQLKKHKGKSKVKTKINDKVLEYDPSKTFLKGQILYHRIFDDIGRITKIITGNGETEKINVKFKKAGKKILIQGISPSK